MRPREGATTGPRRAAAHAPQVPRRRKSAGTSIVLADDHAVVRQGLRVLLNAEAGLMVVGEAADGLAALDLVEKLRPAVLVVDLIMPGLNGLDVTRRVTRRRAAKTRVVILSMHTNEAYLIEAFKNGALAYVRKDASSDQLITAIREAAEGRRYLSLPYSEKSIEAYLAKAREPEVDSYQTLTARERQIFQLTAESLSSHEIAERLFISPRTVETHRQRIHKKLGVHGQADIVRFALSRGILLLDDRSKT